MPIRVLRILEYLYDNQEHADQDMANWLGGIEIRSTTVPDMMMRMHSTTMYVETVERKDGEQAEREELDT